MKATVAERWGHGTLWEAGHQWLGPGGRGGWGRLVEALETLPEDEAALHSRWAWILQDALGIAFCLYTLKTIRLPTFKVRVPQVSGSSG